jgi:hypothetical protein
MGTVARLAKNHGLSTVGAWGNFRFRRSSRAITLFPSLSVKPLREAAQFQKIASLALELPTQ